MRMQQQSRNPSNVVHDLPISARLKREHSAGISVAQPAVVTLSPNAACSLSPRSKKLSLTESIYRIFNSISRCYLREEFEALTSRGSTNDRSIKARATITSCHKGHCYCALSILEAIYYATRAYVNSTHRQTAHWKYFLTRRIN